MEEERRKNDKIDLPGFDTENLVLSKKVINIEISAKTDEDEHFIPRYIRKDRRSQTTRLRPSEINELYKKVKKAEDKIKPIKIEKESLIFEKDDKLTKEKPKEKKEKIILKEEKEKKELKEKDAKPIDKKEKIKPKGKKDEIKPEVKELKPEEEKIKEVKELEYMKEILLKLKPENNVVDIQLIGEKIEQPKKIKYDKKGKPIIEEVPKFKSLSVNKQNIILELPGLPIKEIKKDKKPKTTEEEKTEEIKKDKKPKTTEKEKIEEIKKDKKPKTKRN